MLNDILFGIGLALLLGIGVVWVVSIGWLLAEEERPFIALAVFLIGAATIFGVVHAKGGFDSKPTVTITKTITKECPR